MNSANYNKKPRQRREAVFERTLATAAPYFKCLYVKIKDPRFDRMRIKARAEGDDLCEVKRPYDGTLFIREDDDYYGYNIVVELKYGDNTMEKHQKEYMEMINRVNKSSFLIRAKGECNNYVITVEQPEKNIVYKTDNVVDLFQWLLEQRIPKKIN